MYLVVKQITEPPQFLLLKVSMSLRRLSTFKEEEQIH